MLFSHDGMAPQVDASAYVAHTATVCGNVIIEEGARILHGACVIGEGGGAIRIGRNCIIMENAVVRADPSHPCAIGDSSLIGPNAHVTGAEVGEEVFIATGVAIFHGAKLGKRSQVRIGGVVHLRTELEEETVVPIGWVAVGQPPKVLPPDRHDEIWKRQKPLNFPEYVYGIKRDTSHRMRHVTEMLSRKLGAHRHDKIVR